MRSGRRALYIFVHRGREGVGEAALGMTHSVPLDPRRAAPTPPGHPRPPARPGPPPADPPTRGSAPRRGPGAIGIGAARDRRRGPGEARADARRGSTIAGALDAGPEGYASPPSARRAPPRA